MSNAALTKKDFESDQEVRWCPGCGDYAILATVQRLLPQLGIPKEKLVFVSGIGCSSRFPYYMNTYGFHTIHGRAPAIATGIKVANPELNVWVVTGDGDGLSIGGNHLVHLFRRNVDLNILLFNNRIYGLTKGQYSPTSETGKHTKSTPYGSVEEPLDPILLALAAKATFVARGMDNDAKGLAEILEQASRHKGTSFVEIFQNCNVFNDGAFEQINERSVRAERQIHLRHGEPLTFGADRSKGIVLDGLTPRIVEQSDSEAWKQVLVHDETNRDLAFILGRLPQTGFPVPMGILYRKERPSFEALIHDQLAAAAKERGKGDLQKLLQSSDCWRVG